MQGDTTWRTHAAGPAFSNGNLDGSGGLLRNRWFQLFIGVLAWGLAANLQYGWTSPGDAR